MRRVWEFSDEHATTAVSACALRRRRKVARICDYSAVCRYEPFSEFEARNSQLERVVWSFVEVSTAG